MVAALINLSVWVILTTWLLTHFGIRWVQSQIAAAEARIDAKLVAAHAGIVRDSVAAYQDLNSRKPSAAA